MIRAQGTAIFARSPRCACLRECPRFMSSTLAIQSNSLLLINLNLFLVNIAFQRCNLNIRYQPVRIIQKRSITILAHTYKIITIWWYVMYLVCEIEYLSLDTYFTEICLLIWNLKLHNEIFFLLLLYHKFLTLITSYYFKVIEVDWKYFMLW